MQQFSPNQPEWKTAMDASTQAHRETMDSIAELSKATSEWQESINELERVMISLGLSQSREI